MVAVFTKLILVFMEISIFASLFTPPGLSTSHVPLRASVSSSNGQQQQGSSHASASSTTERSSGNLHAYFGLNTRPEPSTLIKTHQQHESTQASGSSIPAASLSGRRGPKSPGGARPSPLNPQQRGPADVMVTASRADAVGASINYLSAEPLTAKRSTRASKFCSKFCTAKRAFKRAQRRALEHGSTMYRGRICTAASLGCHSLHVQDNFSATAPKAPSGFNPPRNQLRINRPGAQQVHQKSEPNTRARTKVLSFNLGGLCTATYDVLMQWLQHEGRQYDVIMLQETHYGLGREPRCYQVPGWTVCSSPDPNTRFSGVAILVSARLAACADLQYHHVIPGRLLHVRLPIGTGRQARSLDVISCYQYSWDADPLKNRLTHRLEFWHRLAGLAQSLPKRNCHLIGGDFNCSLRPIPQRVGPGLCASSARHPDTGEFCELLSTSGLCALNSWTAANKAFTYQMPGSQPVRSHIDFLLVNKACADGAAKLSKPDHKLCFSPWRGGARHYAVVATIKACFRLAPQQKRPGSGFSRESFRLAARAQNSGLAAFKQELTDSLPIAQAADPASLNAAVLECCQRHFPSQPQHRPPRPWQCADIQTTVKDMWAAHQAYGTALTAFHRSTSRELLRLAYGVFRCYAQFRSRQQILRKRGTQKRRSLFLQDLEVAEQAATQGDIHLLYKQIRRLAPKTKHERIQLRQSDGKMMTKESEFATIKGYFTTVFTRDRPENLAQPRSATYSPTLERVERALRQSRSGRAIPGGSVPPEIWHYCADILAPAVSSMFQTFLAAGTVSVPPTWTECWLKLLPKPQKPAHLVANLRPIALQDPIGKALARLIKQDILEKIMPAVQGTPQFAYLPRRSTTNAISRAAQFCDAIRCQLRDAKTTVWTRKAGHRQNPHHGGAIFSLDMSKAFDMVSHTYLEQSLRHLQVDGDLISLILSIHNTHYHIEHGTHQGTIPLGNGIRQGCVLSPILWVCVTHYMLHQLESKLTEMGDSSAQAWIRDSMTLFADDFLATFQLESLNDVSVMCLRIGCLFQILESSGMCVNPDKSKLLFKASGRQLAKWLTQRTVKKHGNKFVQIGTPFSQIQVGLSQTLTYLGVVLSFDNFELQTMRHRLHQARQAVGRLSRLLFKKRGLSTRHKIRVYLTCVRSTATYGVHVMGITPKSLQLLSGLEARHLRCLAGIRRADEAISKYARFSIGSISDYLVQTSQRRIDALSAMESLCFPGVENDLAWQRRIHTNLTNPTSLLEPSNKPRRPTLTTFECPTCAVSFSSLHALRTHIARKHKQQAAVPASLLKKGEIRSKVDIKQHCVQGMPTCKHCGQSFQKWHGFKGHILSACPVLHQQAIIASAPSPADSGLALQSAAGSTEQGEQRPVASTEAPVPSLSAGYNSSPDPPQPAPINDTLLEMPTTLAIADQPNLLVELRADWVRFAEKNGQSLKQYCVYCTQWCNNTAGLKTHLRRAHPEVWKANGAVNSRMKQQHRLKYRGLCRACAFQPTGPQAGALHSYKCPAYFQACLLHYHSCPQENVGGGRGSECVRRPAQGGFQLRDEAAPCRSPDRAGRATKVVPPSNQGRERSAEHKPQLGEPRSPERPQLGMQLGRRQSVTHRDGERDPGARTPGYADAPCAAPGRLPSRSAGGLLLHALPRHERRDVHDEDALGDVPTLEKIERRGVQQSHPKLEGHSDDGPLHGAEITHGHGPGRQDAPYVREARLADPGRGSEVGLSDVGSRGQGDEDGRQQGPDLARHHAEGDRQAPHPSPDQPGSEVPRHTAHGSGVPGQHADYDGHDQQSRLGSGRALRPAPGHVRQLRSSADRSQNAPASSAQAAPRHGTRTAGQGPSQCHQAAGGAAGQRRGEASGEVDRPASLILSNPHNVCYINSVVSGLHWVGQHCQASEVFGSFTSAFRAVTNGTKRNPCYIPSLLPWLPLLRGWTRLSSQHDACEFLTHLLSKISPTCFTGSWEARLNDADLVEVRGSGTFFAPLPMDLPSVEHASLQQIINHWHMQETTNALLSPPRFLLIQLKRYVMQGMSPSKLHTCVPLSTGARIQVPCFVGGSLSTIPVVYTLCFAVAHDGLTVNSGHYRCALFPMNGTPFLSDDGVPPRPMDRSEISRTESRCYLICLRRAGQFDDE